MAMRLSAISIAGVSGGMAAIGYPADAFDFSAPRGESGLRLSRRQVNYAETWFTVAAPATPE
jgi:hypothetical protein